MREGEVVSMGPGEKVTCIRSGQSGGPFIFEVELAPGTGGPPTHTHDEGDEIVEVLDGEVVFRVNGRKTLLRAGDTLTLKRTDAHTFWNPSRTKPVRARVTHGARFERLVDQPGLLALLMYLTYVDPGASRTTNPVMKLLVRLAALFGRVRGVRPVVAGAQASTGGA